MPPHTLTLPSFVLTRLGAGLLALAALVPGGGLRAAPPAEPAFDSPPVANDDSLAAFTDQGWQQLYVLDNDTDPDFDTITVSNVTFASHGQAVGGGLTGPFFAIDYKPDAGFSGTDHFSYAISDGHGLTDTATVTVHVGASGTASSRFAIYATSKDGYDSSLWTVNPKSGASSATGSGVCNGGSGLGIEDVLLQNPLEHMKAFDTGLTLWINDHQVKPALPMAVTHRSLVSGPTSLGGVNVTVQYDGLVGSDTLRTLVVLANTSGSTKTFTATVATNVGSDLTTTVVGTSSGDTHFTAADRWLVTSDSPTNPGLIVDTHVLFGAGALATPTAVYTSTFTCNENPVPNTLGVRADFHLSIPNGTAQRLLFFNQAHKDNASALADAAAFFTGNPVGLLGGISNVALTQIVNWKLGPVSRLFLPLVRR